MPKQRHVGLLLRQVGGQTSNRRTDVTSTAGIPDNRLIQYFNDAQTRLQTLILEQMPNCTNFDTSVTRSLTANDDTYDISDGDAFYDGHVRAVQYRRSSTERWYTLDPDFPRHFSGGTSSGSPACYGIRGAQIIVEPVPQSTQGSLRIWYIRALDTLDKRRGKIETINSSGGNYTTAVLEDDADLDRDEIALWDYLCVNDSDGNVVYYNANYTDFDPDTNTITFSGAATSVGTISVGDYITLGQYTTTHSKLVKEAERYLLEYCAWKIYREDSSEDTLETNKELAVVERDVVSGYGRNSLAPQHVTISEPEWFDDGY